VSVGDQVNADLFGGRRDSVDVVGKSKGSRFRGHDKRHNFSRGPIVRTVDRTFANRGSIGQSRSSREYQGEPRSSGIGDDRVTVKGLTVAKSMLKNNLIMVRGAVPRKQTEFVVVRKGKKLLRVESQESRVGKNSQLELITRQPKWS